MHKDAYPLGSATIPEVPSAAAGIFVSPGIDAQRSLAKQDLLTPYFQFRQAPVNALESDMAQEMFKLRYEVYCIERGFLPADNFDKGLEIDEFDEHATHFGGYNMENLIVGSVRLVQPPAAIPFPFEQHCQVFESFKFPPREQASEISRLVVRKSYRRRRGDSLQGISKQFMDKENAAVRPSLGGRRRNGDSPRLLLGLYREMYRHSRATGVRYWYAAMERSLAFSLRKMGFKFMPIGPATDYYGPVTPFIVDLDELNDTLRKENRLLAAWFNDEPIPLWLRMQMWVMLQASKLHR